MAFTIGTAAPTGGADGDGYWRYGQTEPGMWVRQSGAWGRVFAVPSTGGGADLELTTKKYRTRSIALTDFIFGLKDLANPSLDGDDSPSFDTFTEVIRKAFKNPPAASQLTADEIKALHAISTGWRGLYADNTAYVAGELVANAGNVFLCLAPVPATNTDAPADGSIWKELGGGAAAAESTQTEADTGGGTGIDRISARRMWAAVRSWFTPKSTDEWFIAVNDHSDWNTDSGHGLVGFYNSAPAAGTLVDPSHSASPADMTAVTRIRLSKKRYPTSDYFGTPNANTVAPSVGDVFYIHADAPYVKANYITVTVTAVDSTPANWHLLTVTVTQTGGNWYSGGSNFVRLTDEQPGDIRVPGNQVITDASFIARLLAQATVEGDPVTDGTEILLRVDGQLKVIPLAHIRRHLGNGYDFPGYTWKGTSGNNVTQGGQIARVGTNTQFVLIPQTNDDADLEARVEAGNLFEVYKDVDNFMFGVASQDESESFGKTYITVSAIYAKGSLSDGDTVKLVAYTPEADTILPYVSSLTSDNAKIGNTAVPMRYEEGAPLYFKNVTANTGNVTININLQGAKKLLQRDGSEIPAGGLLAGATYHAIYDGTDYRLVAPLMLYRELVRDVDAFTADKTLTAGDNGSIQVFGGSAAATLNLWDADEGESFWLINGGTAIVTVDPDGSDTIDGSATMEIETGHACLIAKTAASAWAILSDKALGGDFTLENLVPFAAAFRLSFTRTFVLSATASHGEALVSTGNTKPDTSLPDTVTDFVGVEQNDASGTSQAADLNTIKAGDWIRAKRGDKFIIARIAHVSIDTAGVVPVYAFWFDTRTAEAETLAYEQLGTGSGEIRFYVRPVPLTAPSISAKLTVTSSWQNIATGYADDDIVTVTTEGAYSSEANNIAMAGMTDQFSRIPTGGRWLGIRANANGARIEIRRNGQAIQARTQGSTSNTKAWATKWPK